MPIATDKPTADKDKAKQQMVAANPFVRAAAETVEGAFVDNTTTIQAASATQVSDQPIPPFGWLRGVLLRVTASGGTGAPQAAVADEDAPWNVLADITLTDVNGRALVGPINGYDLYLAAKWLGEAWDSDPANSPVYSAVAGTGDFDFLIRLPVEVSQRDGLCSLPNQNSSATYKLSYTIAAATTVYTTSPTGLPDVRVRAYMEAWSPTEPADPNGTPNQQQPPAPGSTQHWTKSTPSIAAGEQRVRLTRVGNMIRGLVFQLRDAAGDRTTTDFPDAIRVEWDNRNLFVFSRDVLRHYMRERTGQAPDDGVLVIDFAHDLDGKIGAEMRDQWLPTTEATRFDVVGSFGANASALTILTNDVAPAGAVHI